MERKITVKKWVIPIIAIVLLVSLVNFFSADRMTVSAQSIISTGEPFTATLSSAISKDAFANGELFVKDQQGKIVPAQYSVSESGKIVKVIGLEEGDYTLHVKSKLGKTRFDFKVHKEITSVKSKEELKAYFELVRQTQGERKNITVFSEGAALENSRESSDSAAADHSTTNNQVEGVDEADSVQTNGSHLFAISENNVAIFNIENPAKMQEVAKINLANEFYPSQLLLTDDTLIIIGQKNIYHTLEMGTGQDMARIGRPMNSMTNVYFYNISNPASPKLLREIATEGYMNGARLTNNTLYYVTTVYPNIWLMEENEDVELRPYVFDSKTDKEEKPMDYNCISILPSTLEATYSIISAIDVDNPKENELMTQGYLGGSEQLYMSKNNLYLTSTIYDYEWNHINTKRMIWNPAQMDMEVFKFELDKTAVQFVASRRLSGTILNQFSMDEHAGYFRAVTTKGNSWNENEPSENNLFILDSGMKIVGSVTGLAKGERIYSARFMGDKAYMVTFKQTDPLFVIDVANPTAPKVLGELKIPGFSNYLHPLDENHLIGFGYETKAIPQEGNNEPLVLTEGMKVSLFDVSDLANPKEIDTEVIGARGTYSPLQYDHHALFQYREKSLYGFPVSIYEEGKGDEYAKFKQGGALIYEITPENGIVLKGDLLNPEKPGQLYEEWEKSVQRMLYAGDALFTVAPKEITSYNLHTFEKIGKIAYE